MDYLKANHLSLAIILWLIASPFLGMFGTQSFGALDRTTVGNPWTFSGTVTHSAAVTNSSTMTQTGVATFTAQPVFDGGMLQSSVFATTSTGAGTLTAANITGVNTILSTNAGALTLTMPASSTLSAFVPTAGDRVSMVIVNQGTTLLTLAGGTGTLLQTASSTKTVNIGGSALLEFVRKTNTDIVVLMSPGI